MSLTLEPLDPLSLREVEILRHTLGMNRKMHPYRNHYVAPEGTVDYPVCMTLVERGLMRRHQHLPTGQATPWFSCTEHVPALFAPPEDCFS